MISRALLGYLHIQAGTWLFCLLCLLVSIGTAEFALAQTRDNGIGGLIARADEGAVAEVNHHDAHALAARYWNDAIDISPAGVVSGRSEIEHRFAEVFKNSDPRNFVEHIDRMNFSDDRGWLVGHWSDTRLAVDGSRHPAKGYVAVFLEKRTGEWKVRLHVITEAP